MGTILSDASSYLPALLMSVLLIVLTGLALLRSARRSRTKDYLNKDNGWTYVKQGDRRLDRIWTFHPFDQGYAHRCHNLRTGTVGTGTQFMSWDHTYLTAHTSSETVGLTRHSEHRHELSIVAVRLTDRTNTVRIERMGTWLHEQNSTDMIEVRTPDDSFTRRYQVSAQDEQEAMQLLCSDVIDRISALDSELLVLSEQWLVSCQMGAVKDLIQAEQRIDALSSISSSLSKMNRGRSQSDI